MKKRCLHCGRIGCAPGTHSFVGGPKSGPTQPDLNAPLPPPQDSDGPAVWDLVVDDMKGRDDFGFAKYGTRLKAHNGRPHINDAYQESLDLAVYLRAEIIIREEMNARISDLEAQLHDARTTAEEWQGMHRVAADRAEKAEAQTIHLLMRNEALALALGRAEATNDEDDAMQRLAAMIDSLTPKEKAEIRAAMRGSEVPDGKG